MKKQAKKLMTGALIGGMLFSMAATALAGGPPWGSGVTSGTSDAQVEFESPTGAAALYLDNVPELDFDKHTIGGSDMYYAAKTTSKPLEVVELRGSGVGFKVKVSLNEFVEDGTSTKGLAGVSIAFKAIDGTTTFNVTTPGTLHTATTISASTLPANATRPSAQATTITAAAVPTAEYIFKAPVNTNNNRWGAHWMGDAAASEGAATLGKDVELKVVFGTNQAKKYVSKLNWDLEDTP